MEKVLVLLSTFNGEKYLEAQIQSLLAQDYQNLGILIRDDGSTDGTKLILQNFEKQFPKRIQVEYGKNVGYRNSFFRLMETVPTDCSFYAFCDQDDYWLPQKISKAISTLQSMNQKRPLYYCSRLTMVDKDLKVTGYSDIPRQPADFRQYFFSSIPTGSTTVFNDELRRIALAGRELARNHDSWMLLVASFFGEIFVDHDSFILYRQHGSNTLGLELNFWRKSADKLCRILRKDVKFNNISAFAGLFLQQYSQLMSDEQKTFVSMVAGYRQSLRQTLRLALSPEIRTSNWYDTLAVRFLVLLQYI